jgi:hypothetical protein
MLIQVDVDSTLYDADKLFGDLCEEAGIKWPRRSNSWSQPDGILKMDGSVCSRDDLTRVFRKAHSKEVIMTQKPYPRAAETLGRIAEMYDNVEIAYVSDRHSSQAAALNEWLEANGFLHTEDQHVVATKDKRQWMREKRPDVVIDDRVRTMLMARYELGSYVISLMHNHNVNLLGEADHIYIVKQWASKQNRMSDEDGKSQSMWQDKDNIDYVLHEIVIPKIEEKGLGRNSRPYELV